GPVVDLGPDTLICHFDLILDAGYDDPYSVLWNDGSEERYLNVFDTGLYYVSVTDTNGCEGDDSIYIGTGTLDIDLGEDFFICNEDSHVLDGGEEGTYLWSDGSTERFLTVFDADVYFLEVNDGICIGVDTIVISSSVSNANFNYSDTVGCFPFS